MMLCIENWKDSTKNLLELIHEFGKVAGHKPTYRNWLTNKVELEGTCFNIIKALCENPTANMILKGEKLRALLL